LITSKIADCILEGKQGQAYENPADEKANWKEHEAQLASVGVSTSEYADAPSASGQDEEAAQ